jgi:hypothetical protein
MELFRSRVCFFGRRGLSNCGGVPLGNDVVLVSLLFLWWTWAQSLQWRANMKGRWSSLASVPFVGVDSITVWTQSLWWPADRQGRCSGLAYVPLVGVDSVTVVAG